MPVSAILYAMAADHTIRRYSAYFKGWAQAFGAHLGDMDESRTLNWLYSEEDDQIGLILTERIRRPLFHEVLGHRETETTLWLGPEHIGIGGVTVPAGPEDEQAIRMLRWLLDARGELHLFLTYHLFFPQGTRILTLGRKAPLPILYKEIKPITVRIG